MRKREQQQEFQTFQQTTNKFELILQYNRHRIYLSLKDLVDLVLYERQYTRQDLAEEKEVYSKVDLEDIYYSFVSSQQQTDEILEMEREKPTCVKDYEFGEVIKQEGDIPCYKIQQNGVVTIYIPYFDRRFNKNINYESRLYLNRVRPLNETEIKAILGQRDSLTKAYKKQIETVTKQNNQVKTENEELKKELQTLKKQMEEKAKASEKLQQAKKLQKIVFGLPTPCRMFYSVSLTHRRVTHFGMDCSIQFFFNQIIPSQTKYTFKIKIDKTRYRCISIGIADYEKQKTCLSSVPTFNAVSYFGNGMIFPDRILTGNGFCQGEIVEVTTNLRQESIKWSVDGVQRAVYKNRMLSDNSRKFYPYFETFHGGDMLQWIPNFE